ncbi:MAG: hypothetical protein KF901_14510 [Myxococcales bacterium]|nr:hypothetical protein [Myxococcales bacterium]
MSGHARDTLRDPASRGAGSGVFERRHAGPHEIEAVLRSADEARAVGVPFHRWQRTAPSEWRSLSVPQRLAIEALVWGTLSD